MFFLWAHLSYTQLLFLCSHRLQVGAQSTPLYASATTTNAPNFAYFPSANTNPPAQPAPVVAQPAAPEQPAAAQPQQQPQRRFPNIVVEEPQENRDWLDICYFMLRITVVLTVIYLYSSPIRCLAVFSIGIALYLYRRGVFQNQIVERNQQQQQPQNQNNNNNNVDPVPQPVVDGAQPIDAAASTVATPQDQNRTSWLVLIRTFILSFIFSLIPETPAL